MSKHGERFITNGTDNHLIMWDVRPHDLTGAKVDKVLDAMHITTNKNALVGDKSALNPGGVRLGTPAMTTRGMKEAEMEVISGFLLRAIAIAKRIQGSVGKQLKDFLPALDADEEIKQVGEEVKAFASKYSIPGI
jgi:glycine hydroxymethyltransferase